MINQFKSKIVCLIEWFTSQLENKYHSRKRGEEVEERKKENGLNNYLKIFYIYIISTLYDARVCKFVVAIFFYIPTFSHANVCVYINVKDRKEQKNV